MVGEDGLEPSTFRLSGERSNQLSYSPQFVFLTLFIVKEEYFFGNENAVVKVFIRLLR